MRELRVPSNADDSAIQEALMKLFNVQTRDQTKSVAVEDQASKAKKLVTNSVERSGQVIKAKRSVTDSDQVLKASDSVSDQFGLVQSESESKTSRSV